VLRNPSRISHPTSRTWPHQMSVAVIDKLESIQIHRMRIAMGRPNFSHRFNSVSIATYKNSW
jgi:hypothetical protein